MTWLPRLAKRARDEQQPERRIGQRALYRPVRARHRLASSRSLDALRGFTRRRARQKIQNRRNHQERRDDGETEVSRRPAPPIDHQLSHRHKQDNADAAAGPGDPESRALALGKGARDDRHVGHHADQRDARGADDADPKIQLPDR